MDVATRLQLIREYRQGYELIADALKHVGAQSMDRKPSPDDWSPRQIVHHLADSEMTGAIRLRRLLTEEKPVIVGYNEQAYAQRLYYDRPFEASLELFRSSRATTAEILDRMTKAEWRREGTHTESGRYTVETWLGTYAAHGREHAAQLLGVSHV